MSKYIQVEELGLGFAPQLPMTVKTKKGVPIAWLTSDYGWRMHPTLKYPKHHNGVDIGSQPSTPLYALEDGVVVRVFKSDVSGNVVDIGYKLTSSGKFKYRVSYSHMVSRALVKKGDIVSKGQVVGFVGTTGRSTGPHLHLIVKKLQSDGSYDTTDPLKFIGGKLPVSKKMQEKGGNYSTKIPGEGFSRDYGKEVKLPASSMMKNLAGVAMIGAVYWYVNKK